MRSTQRALLAILAIIAVAAPFAPRTALCCDSDADCKGDRVCRTGACTNAGEPTPKEPYRAGPFELEMVRLSAGLELVSTPSSFQFNGTKLPSQSLAGVVGDFTIRPGGLCGPYCDDQTEDRRFAAGSLLYAGARFAYAVSNGDLQDSYGMPADLSMFHAGLLFGMNIPMTRFLALNPSVEGGWAGWFESEDEMDQFYFSLNGEMRLKPFEHWALVLGAGWQPLAPSTTLWAQIQYTINTGEQLPDLSGLQTVAQQSVQAAQEIEEAKHSGIAPTRPASAPPVSSPPVSSAARSEEARSTMAHEANASREGGPNPLRHTCPSWMTPDGDTCCYAGTDSPACCERAFTSHDGFDCKYFCDCGNSRWTNTNGTAISIDACVGGVCGVLLGQECGHYAQVRTKAPNWIPCAQNARCVTITPGPREAVDPEAGPRQVCQ